MSQVLMQALQSIGLSNQESEHLMHNMKETCADWLLLHILRELPPQVVQKLDSAIMAGVSPHEITVLLRNELPNIDSVLMDKLRVFQDELATSLLALPSNLPVPVAIPPLQGNSSISPSTPKIVVEAKKTPQEIENKHMELGKLIREATKKGDWATAAQLMQEQKSMQEERKA